MMKFAASLVFAGALLALGANAQNPPEIQRSTKSAAKTPVPAPVIAPLGAGTTFNASLDDPLDTRKSKAGDVITAETAEDVTYEQCLIFPKGTPIVGHVVRVTSGGHGRTGAAIFVQFDKAMMKDGQEVYLNAGIQALAGAGVAPMPSDAASKSLDAATHEVPVQESSTSGGATAADAVVVSTIYEPTRPVVRPPSGAPLVTEGEFNSDGLFTPESKGAFGRPDLKVYTPTSEGSHGTVLLSAKKNMHVESGTHLLLVVQPPSTGESEGTSGPLDLDPNQ
jgi:hypothetical protein